MTATARVAALALAALASASLAGKAAPVLSGDAPPTYDINAQARNGRTGWEGILKTPGHPGGLTMNPVGAPVWSYGNPHKFELQYTYLTGQTTWRIDFNRDDDFVDNHEWVTSVSPTLVGQSFVYANLYLQGRGTPSVSSTVNNFTINGTNFGTFASTGDTPVDQLFEDTGGLFGDLSITGELVFSGNGNTDERPRLWVRLGSAQQVAVVPEPGTFGLLAFGLIPALRRRRRA